MLTPDLLTEAVAAVRTAAMADAEPDYWRIAHEVVMHRVVHLTTYGWPLMGGFAALWVVAEIARRARHEDGCRCGEPRVCEHYDEIDSGVAAERG